jgi:PKD repeat protein
MSGISPVRVQVPLHNQIIQAHPAGKEILMCNGRQSVRIVLFVLFGVVLICCAFWQGQLDAAAAPAQQGTMEPPPPLNDLFVNASPLPAPPFSVGPVNIRGAGMEPGESVPTCAQWEWGFGNTIWYTYEPATTGSLALRPYSWEFPVVLAVYRSLDPPSPASLTQVFCYQYYYDSAKVVQMEAGNTYYLQLGTLYDYPTEYMNPNVWLEGFVPPPPEASFYYYPDQPSTVDYVSFNNNSWDPYSGIASCAWNFGDGSVASDCYPTHRFTTEGDYSVQLTVTTYDGRTGSTTSTVAVRNHDVAITKFSVPQSAQVGQTRSIVVGINSKLHPETVRVYLESSTPQGGWTPLGELRQYVPVRSSNRTTDFAFSYTFSPQDALMGKVSFRATANIDANDMYPADNQAISFAVKVNAGKKGGVEASAVIEEPAMLQAPEHPLFLPLIKNP